MNNFEERSISERTRTTQTLLRQTAQTTIPGLIGLFSAVGYAAYEGPHTNLAAALTITSLGSAWVIESAAYLLHNGERVRSGQSIITQREYVNTVLDRSKKAIKEYFTYKGLGI